MGGRLFLQECCYNLAKAEWPSRTVSLEQGRRRKRQKDRRRRPVCFDCSFLYKDQAEAVGEVELRPEGDEGISHYVNVVRSGRPSPEPPPRRGLMNVTVDLPDGFGVRAEDDAEDAEPPCVVKCGRRVVCAVGNFEALSGGYIDCLPSQMLADTGAMLSLINRRVLKRLGRPREPLEPSDGCVSSSSGHKLRVHGWINLPVSLGTKEVVVRMVVTDKLHVDAILGVDALGAFGAVIDVAQRTLALKGTGEVLPLGVTVVHEAFMATMASSIRLPPRGQALVVTNIVGDAEEASVALVEGASGLPPTLGVSRSLCTISEGKVVVEICNASTEEYWVRKGTIVASASAVPESTFGFEKPTGKVEPSASRVPSEDVPVEVVISVAEEREDKVSEKVKVTRPDVPPDKDIGVKADFSESDVSAEQKALFREALNGFHDMFVESSMRPGKTEMLYFKIDSSDSQPIKQQPYRVSLAEGEVMEAKIQQYLEQNLIRPSNSPWASPVLMIRKPDGGIRFCIDYRRLNAVTVKDCYPMPLIDDILDVLGCTRLISTMDIASGYWNVPMAEDSIPKTAFTCKYGLYEWLVMPFGLCNAVPAFERLMETVLVDMKWRICLVYLDDCVIFSKDFPTHLVRVRQVLTRFREAGFKLKMKKCHWGQSQVAFLGHIVTPTGILPNP
ncbi:hypothetical protein PC119_g17587 [Phytophthora cactorum]|uniref:Reverse transcriptase domain-containing protein n=1 Tax=Phytophthora cactorum TaxID=29920 RepID=A0A8T1CHE0_9STRA|nr:hypothetical protein PC117_g16407 [Phytophthora cactorum]KAG2997844.1 hypothetical protein PC119_g17587 [Phytophthora cactorum]